jgi:hypothetical protein
MTVPLWLYVLTVVAFGPIGVLLWQGGKWTLRDRLAFMNKRYNHLVNLNEMLRVSEQEEAKAR